MVCGVKERHIGGFGNRGVYRFYDLEGTGIVKRCESREGLEVVVGVGIDSGRLGIGASVNDAMAGESDVIGMLEFCEVFV